MISVVLAVYNNENFIGEAIESILNQTFTDFELIIINDGSSDRTEEVIQSFSDSRIRYVKQENKGVAGAKNAGLKLAQGDFITIHDSDDISLPNRFERMLKGLESSDIGFTHCDMLLMNEKGQPFGYWQSNNIFPESMYSFFLNIGTPFNNPTILFKKEAVNGLLFDESVKVGSDTDHVLQIAREWKSYHIPEPLYLYRRHQTNVTNNKNYEVLTKHVKKHLNEEELKWITEVNWQTPEENPFFKAKLIAGVALSRRWLLDEAIYLFREAIPLIKNQQDRDLFEGMKGLVEKDFQRSIDIFRKMPEKDHIIENYLGEALLSLKKYDEAFLHFRQALSLHPNYNEPLQNIRALGLLKGHHSIDRRVNRYK
ncbi:glycosyltransferase [Neobacillus drentensis]|uniref:glycosyltransferase n=1 Tax=Neobacillus drentensis TaxID=220684 RepID=UPI003000B1AE